MYPSPRLAEARAEAFDIDERQSLISSYLIDIRGPGCPDFPAPIAIPVNKRSGIAMGNGKLLHLGESGAGLRMQACGVCLLKSKGGVMRERAVLAPVHAFEICRMKTKRSVGFRKRESSDPKHMTNQARFTKKRIATTTITTSTAISTTFASVMFSTSQTRPYHDTESRSVENYSEMRTGKDFALENTGVDIYAEKYWNLSKIEPLRDLPPPG